MTDEAVAPPPDAPSQFITGETVQDAIRRLADSRPGSKGHTVLLGLLVLKSRATTPDLEIPIAPTGPTSVRAELDRFFGIATGTAQPYLNPFGKLEWLRTNYERFGVFTHLYPSRTLRPFVEVVPAAGTVTAVKLPEDWATRLGDVLREKVPLEPTAAFLLRNEAFGPTASTELLTERFRNVFNLTEAEAATLFVTDPSFEATFGPTPYGNTLADLDADLRPQVVSAPLVGVGAMAPAVAADDAASDQVTVEAKVLRRLRRAIASATGIALVGPPGTGKSTLARQVIAEAQADPARYGLSQPPTSVFHTAEADWTARTLIGGFYPVGGELIFQPGLVLRAIDANQWLVIDELNRADLDRVMGPLFSFLARDEVALDRSSVGGESKPITLRWDDTNPASGRVETDDAIEYVAGFEWRVLGTYNTADLGRVFTMGAALTRRWATIPVPPLPADQLGAVIGSKVPNLPTSAIPVIEQLYRTHLDLQPLGPAAFIQIARYVGTGGTDDTVADAGATTAELLADGYVLFVLPQLRRLDATTRRQVTDAVSAVLPDAAPDLGTD